MGLLQKSALYICSTRINWRYKISSAAEEVPRGRQSLRQARGS